MKNIYFGKKNDEKNTNFKINWFKINVSRHNFMVFFFAILAIILASRLFILQNNNLFLKKQGDVRTVRRAPITAYRGMITDRNGEPLAISTPVNSAWMSPLNININDHKLGKLAALLDISKSDLIKKIKNNINKDFIYLKRHITPELSTEVTALNLDGVYLQREYRRFYPAAETTAHVVGFTDIDDKGQEGLELSFDEWLAGINGEHIILKDRLGRSIADIENIKEAKNGHDLVLSIDNKVQYLAYRELKHAVKKNKAKAGSVIILDVNTGEILAMVNQPSYNPNARERHNLEAYRNRSVTDAAEPGSLMKIFSMVNILETGKFPLSTKVDTSPGYMEINGNIVKDIENKNNGVLTIPQILAKSSNVGITKLTLKLPQDSLYKTLVNFGFGERVTGSFPGEGPGVLVFQHKWSPFALATMSFGYAMSATPLQIAQGCATIANGGIKLPVSFFKLDKKPSGTRIISATVAQQMIDILEGVAEDGVLGKARVKGYKVAGKTGTAKKVGAKGYEDRYIASFVGFAPAQKPRIVVLVTIDEPNAGIYYGSQVAAPVFAKIMGDTLRVLNITSD